MEEAKILDKSVGWYNDLIKGYRNGFSWSAMPMENEVKTRWWEFLSYPMGRLSCHENSMSVIFYTSQLTVMLIY